MRADGCGKRACLAARMAEALLARSPDTGIADTALPGLDWNDSATALVARQSDVRGYGQR